MTKTCFSHIGIVGKDPIKLERFYTKYFGFTRTRVYDPGPKQVVMIKSGNIYLEIFIAEKNRPDQSPIEAGPTYPGFRHICFLVDDLDAKLKELGNDTRITMGPLDMSKYIPGMKVAWVADPEGNIIELNQGYVDEINPPKLT